MQDNDTKQLAKKINDLADEIGTYQKNKKLVLDSLTKLESDLSSKKITKEEYDKLSQKYLQGKTKEEIIKSHDNYITLLFDEINKEADKILMIYNLSEGGPESKETLVVKGEKFSKLGIKEKEKFMKDVGLDKEFLRLYLRRRKKKAAAEVRIEYQLYKPTQFGLTANHLFEKLTVKLTKSYPKMFEPLYRSLRMSGLKVLSKTYVSMIILITLIAFVLGAIFATLLFKHPFLPIRIVRGIMLGVLIGMIAAAVAYFYPQSMAKQRSRAIKNDLPFMIIHMAAVAGSGAKPISMFKTILSSGEYPALRDEVKKIVNYVTLFGYNLSTALQAVARRTPSLKFKDLLDSIVANIESGGDMREFLQSMADESLTTYKLERKRYVESIATYSDIYTAVLIAAPLLFFVTLAIIQTLGGTIAGVSVSTIAKVGTFGVIPALNVGFLIFLNLVAPQ